MATNHTTMARYFILGLMICLLSAPYLFQIVVPENTKQPQMWISVHTAITGGSFVVLAIGALGGFALSKKLLLPLQTCIVSLLIGYSFICILMTNVGERLALEDIAASSFIIGFLGCWTIAELFGKISKAES